MGTHRSGVSGSHSEVSKVLPFRTNRYVMRELIDWNNLPNDHIFQLVFPQKGMLDPQDRLV